RVDVLRGIALPNELRIDLGPGVNDGQSPLGDAFHGPHEAVAQTPARMSPGSMWNFSPSTAVYAPRPSMMKRIAAGSCRWQGAVSPGFMYCTPQAIVVQVAPAGLPVGYMTRLRRSTPPRACSGRWNKSESMPMLPDSSSSG